MVYYNKVISWTQVFYTNAVYWYLYFKILDTYLNNNIYIEYKALGLVPASDVLLPVGIT